MSLRPLFFGPGVVEIGLEANQQRVPITEGPGRNGDNVSVGMEPEVGDDQRPTGTTGDPTSKQCIESKTPKLRRDSCPWRFCPRGHDIMQVLRVLPIAPFCGCRAQKGLFRRFSVEDKQCLGPCGRGMMSEPRSLESLVSPTRALSR